MLVSKAIEKWPGYAQFYRSEYGNFSQQHRQSPGKMPCRMILSDIGPHQYSDPEVPELVIGSHLEVVKPGRVAWSFGNGWSKQAWAPNTLVALPPNTPSTWKADCERRALIVVIPVGTLRRVLGASSPMDFTEAFAPLARDTWTDPFLQALLLKLWDVSHSQRRTDYLVADGLLTTVLGLLAQRAGTVDLHRKVALSPKSLGRVIDFATARLEERIDVLDMANVAGLSERHFSRAFTQETGETPHRWLMRQRIDKAKSLLLNSDLDCMVIAIQCGFASQSHLSVAMKQHVGMGPSAWRKLNR